MKLQNILRGVAMLAIAGLGSSVEGAPSKKILVVVSSEDKITLKDGIVHPTGFFLSEMMVPVQALVKAGYTPVFANPRGNTPAMDVISDSAFWFRNQDEYVAIRSAFDALSQIKNPKRLSDVIDEGLDQYAGVFLPGGHAPMEDLLKDKDMGKIFKYFHAKGKPTALICHGPIALLSALDDSERFVQALSDLGIGKKVSAEELASLTKNWIYQGYKMTAFSTKEEQQEEPGQDDALKGFVKFYPDEALGNAGGHVLVNAIKWRSNVVVDRELITGENPFSDRELAAEFIKALKTQK